MGIRAKRKTGSLPDAEGPSGMIEGQGVEIRILTIGESTAAAVGVPNHLEGPTYRMAKYLNEEIGKTIKWDAVGGTGYNVDRVRKELIGRLPNTPGSPHYIIIMLGGNDTFELRSPLTWRAGMKKLIEQLRQRFPQSRIIITNLPPVKNFTSFNRVLQIFLGTLTDLHRKVIMDFPNMFSNLLYMSEEIDFYSWMKEEGHSIPMEEFFSDGVHPSALTYRLWGEQIGAEIIKMLNQDQSND